MEKRRGEPYCADDGVSSLARVKALFVYPFFHSLSCSLFFPPFFFPSFSTLARLARSRRSFSPPILSIVPRFRSFGMREREEQTTRTNRSVFNIAQQRDRPSVISLQINLRSRNIESNPASDRRREPLRSSRRWADRVACGTRSSFRGKVGTRLDKEKRGPAEAVNFFAKVYRPRRLSPAV